MELVRLYFRRSSSFFFLLLNREANRFDPLGEYYFSGAHERAVLVNNGKSTQELPHTSHRVTHVLGTHNRNLQITAGSSLCPRSSLKA